MSTNANDNASCSIRDPTVMKSARNSCLTDAEVREIARDAGIRVTAQRPHQLIDKLHAKYNTKTGQEDVWLLHMRQHGNNASHALADRLEKTAFCPETPEEWIDNPREWLSDTDIESVLRQYEHHLGDRKKFRFLGVFPSDFGTQRNEGTCISQKMCDTTVQQLIQDGVHNIGIVFNTDPHDKPGRHWTACYIGIDPSNSNRYGAYYYDSVGTAPMSGMRYFMERIKQEADDAGLSRHNEFAIRSNTVRKQFKNTECGMYSTLFIILCLQTNTEFDGICSDALHDDDYTNGLRKTLYRATPGINA
jgi:hypothetical protein